MATACCRSFGAYSSLATYACLHREGVLGKWSYLHISGGRSEIGWAPIAHISLQAEDSCGDWRAAVRKVAHEAHHAGRRAVGYIGFDAVDHEGSMLPDRTDVGGPLIEFIVAGETLTFEGSTTTHNSVSRVNVKPWLRSTLPLRAPGEIHSIHPISGTSRQAFVASVRQALDLIANGQLQKVVVSRYQAYDTDFDPIDLFGRLAEQSTEAFLLCFGKLVAVVPSPESLLTGHDGQVVTNLLAGTRPRSSDIAQDERLRQELRSSHKEIVEHVVCITTMLAELEHICTPNTLTVSRFMEVAVLRHVQHLSSVIKGRLAPGSEVLDALWALFPSVTVTGLPKSRALQTIRELEPHRRYLYSGAVGWISGADECGISLAIRALFRYGNRSFLQAGAGIMAESEPEAEWLETSHKLSTIQEGLAWAAACGKHSPVESRSLPYCESVPSNVGE